MSKAVSTIVELVKERPLTVILGTNVLTAFGALYLHAGGVKELKKLIVRVLFKTVVGSARLVASGAVNAEEAKFRDMTIKGVVGDIKGERYKALPQVRCGEPKKFDEICAALFLAFTHPLLLPSLPFFCLCRHSVRNSYAQCLKASPRDCRKDCPQKK